MGKVAEFMDKVMADETARAEFDAVIGVRKERELSDDDFQKIVGLSEKLGAAVMLDEVKDFFSGNGRELSEEELAGVAGGFSFWTTEWQYQCPLCKERIYTVDIELYKDTGCADWLKYNMKDRIRHHFMEKHKDIMRGWGDDPREWHEMLEKKAEEMINQSGLEEFINNGGAAIDW